MLSRFFYLTLHRNFTANNGWRQSFLFNILIVIRNDYTKF